MLLQCDMPVQVTEFLFFKSIFKIIFVLLSTAILITIIIILKSHKVLVWQNYKNSVVSSLCFHDDNFIFLFFIKQAKQVNYYLNLT